MSGVDISAARIAAARDEIDPVFLDTPQLVDRRLTSELGREVVVKVETLNPIGGFKGRGTSLLARTLDPTRTWVCASAGNFGQGLAYAARKRRAAVHVFVSGDVPRAKVARMRRLGARVDARDRPEAAARAYAAESEDRVLVVDGAGSGDGRGSGDDCGRARFGRRNRYSRRAVR
jgi:threonine dehydratase